MLGNWIFLALARGLGLRWSYVLLAPVSLYYLTTAPKARRASRAYLSRLRQGFGGQARLGVAQEQASWWRVLRHFFAFGQILVDRFAIVGARRSRARFKFEFDGEEHLHAAVREGKGVVLVSAHCGNWEGAAELLERIQAPVNVVAYKGESDQMQAFFERTSAGRRFSFLVADGSADVSLAILAALSRGEIVAMHADRSVGSQGERARFLGSPAWFPIGPYVVAAASGAPLIHAFAMREGLYRYRLYAWPPERVTLAGRARRAREEGKPSEAAAWLRRTGVGPASWDDQDREVLRQCVARFAARLEEMVRRYPLQWHNMYDFWDEEAEPLR